MINGSAVKYGWHHSVSGAVGDMCLHLRVLSRMERRVMGGVGRYLNMSFIGCPEFTRMDRLQSGLDAVAMLMYAGLLSG